MTKKSEPLFKGLITALVTPFKNGEVDRGSFVRLLHRQFDEGVEGFVINGTTAESPTLHLSEVRLLWQIAKSEVGGRVPLILGAGTNSTSATCEMIEELGPLQPDGFLVAVPYYNRPSQAGIFQHFQAAAKAANAPLILYNVPSRTVASLEVETILTLSENPKIAGIKDATGRIEILEELRERLPPDFSLLSGDDGTSAEYRRHGGHGVISVCSHVIAREMQSAGFPVKFQEFLRCLYIEANPIPVKMALHWMGVLDSPEMRLPLTPLDEKFHKEFKACLKSLAKI